jgi:unsaturated chondroitin disaccharide hydrolase
MKGKEGRRGEGRGGAAPGSGADAALWESALQAALGRCRENLGRFPPGAYPAPASVGGRYPALPNIDWTSGFWTGMLWLSFEASGDDAFRNAALERLPDFERRLAERDHIDTHDLGFLYTLSALAAYRITGLPRARKCALDAAELLMERFHAKAGIIQAWGDLSDPAQRGRIIIDCAMNLPLLLWASEASGDGRYREAAKRHLDAANRSLVRPDASSFHTFFFDLDSGAPLRGSTAQGYSDSSCWARGQAWGIYGLSLNYRYLRDPELLETASRLADYYLARLPEDSVPYWDLAIEDPREERDSSAAAIAASGLLELASRLPFSDPRRSGYEAAALAAARSLAREYAAAGKPGCDGLLLHAVYDKPSGKGVDECCIWGDYFYLELLARLARPQVSYW